MSQNDASLAGFKILSSTPAMWSFTSGVAPFVVEYDFQPGDAKALLEKGLKPLSLVLGRQKVEFVYVIQEVASDVPAIRRLQVADLRWFWTFYQHRQAYNVRRKLGEKSLEAPDALSGPRTIIDSVTYAPWSLNNTIRSPDQPPDDPRAAFLPGRPWKAVEVLRSLEQQTGAAEHDTTGAAASKFLGIPETMNDVAIENLFLSGDMATCVAQVMDYLPGLSLYVRPDGDIQFYLQSKGDEQTLISQAGPEKVGGGHIKPVSLSRVRPRKVLVLFNREVEIRVDARSEDPSSTGGPGDRDLYMENVMPSVDYSLTLRDGTIVPQGTWIRIQDALDAWGPLPLVKGNHTLTIADLRRASVPWNPVMEAIARINVTASNVDWENRVGTALEHFRRTYRISKDLMDRIFQLKASRVATLDFATGSRGKSLIYADYSYLSTTRSLFRDAAQGQNKLGYVRNFPIFTGGRFGATQKVAPGSVSVVDPDLGIIHFNFGRDVAGVYGTVFPSQVEISGQNTRPGVQVAGNGISGDLEDKSGNPNCFDILADPDKYPVLTANAALTTVLTAQPALGGFPEVPGNWTKGGPITQFHVIEVKPGDVGNFPGADKCEGPVMQIIVGANLETARVAWVDDDQSAGMVKAMLAIGDARDRATGDVDSVTINAGAFRPQGGASLPAIANAVAKRIYHSLADRPQGSASYDLVPGLLPRGWVDAVSLGIASNGEAFSQLAAPTQVKPLQLESYLPAHIQQLVMRLANQSNS